MSKKMGCLIASNAGRTTMINYTSRRQPTVIDLHCREFGGRPAQTRAGAFGVEDVRKWSRSSSIRTEASLKIAVIGATGRTGRLVIEQALDRGHEVVAYVRQSGTLRPSAAPDIVIGELSDTTRLQAALRSVDAVICCLGTYKHEPVDLLQTNLPLIVRAMKGLGLTRLILLSAYGVGETARTASPVAKILYKTMFRSIFLDRNALRLRWREPDWNGLEFIR